MWNILEPDESLPSIDIERGETIDLLLSLPLLGEDARKLALLSDQIDPALLAALDRSIAEDDTAPQPREPDPFALGEQNYVTALLHSAGFSDIAFAPCHGHSLLLGPVNLPAPTS